MEMIALTPHYVIVVIDMKSVVPMLSPPPPLLAHTTSTPASWHSPQPLFLFFVIFSPLLE